MNSHNKADKPQYTQPVAYDEQGRPLYHHPPVVDGEVSTPKTMVSARPESIAGHNFNPQLRTQYANEPSVVHAPRSHQPVVSKPSEQLERKHQESKRKFTSLNLSQGEFVILRLTRHPIGLIMPLLGVFVVCILLIAALILVPDFYNFMQSAPNSALRLPSIGTIVGVILLLIFIAVAVAVSSVWIYLKNQFFLTNEAIIQQIQDGLFSHHEQMISLGSIEDASYRRQGILQHLFDYGTLRLSTEGEETTYRFSFVENPKKQIAIINDAVEAFKNGRPVGDEFLTN